MTLNDTSIPSQEAAGEPALGLAVTGAAGESSVLQPHAISRSYTTPSSPQAQPSGSRHRRSSSYSRRTSRSHHQHHRHHAHRHGDNWELREEDEHTSGSESGSTSCSTASAYSTERSKGRARRHRHHHHGQAQGRRLSSRRVSVQNVPVARRSTRKQVVIADESSAEEDAGLGRSDSHDSTDSNGIIDEDEDTTVRARQEALNARHPFGLRIWKPALYKKSRSVTRAAFLALHARPSRSETLYLKPGNILWLLLAGWWLMLVCLAVSAVLYAVPFGGRYYARVTAGLGWYLFWPFGRYVERIKDNIHSRDMCSLDATDGATLEAGGQGEHEDAPLLSQATDCPSAEVRHERFRRRSVLGRAVFYVLLVVLVNPILLIVSALSWFAVFSIPMGKLTHTLSRYLWRDPLALHFRSGDFPTVQVPQEPSDEQEGENATVEQPAPTVLLCTNEAIGWYYYKYTVDGVNILFYNMLSVAIFVLFAAFVLAPMTHHQHPLVQPGVLFPLCLVSTVPLAFFIGQAVSSISAQSSLGMGAVINATFGSIVEVILYAIALTQGKSRLVEGALIGSLLAGLMLMPGTSMIAGGIKHKVQRFNAKSAEVTATLIIMSIIGAFAPTLFYQTFSVPEFECKERIDGVRKCTQIHQDIYKDPFYHEQVKPFMYICAAILPLAYLIALWFSLKTHVKHIYSNTQTSNPIVRHVLELFKRALGPDAVTRMRNSANHPPAPLASETTNLAPAVTVTQEQQSVAQGSGVPAVMTTDTLVTAEAGAGLPKSPQLSGSRPPRISRLGSHQHHSHHHSGAGANYHPADTPSSMPNVPRLSELPRVLAADPDDQLPDLALLDNVADGTAEAGGGHGDHDAPNWSKFKSAFILCSCTVIFSLVAEVLVDTVDVVIKSLGIKEKYVGLTLFALVPNVTEFMNAIAFAMQNNIALSIEISNAYTVQVALLQIPILVFFSALYGVPDSVKSVLRLGHVREAVEMWVSGGHGADGRGPTDPSAYMFALIFPRWDLIAILFCVFLLTYMLIEGKANYFKGSILCLSYFVWIISYTFEPTRS